MVVVYNIQMHSLNFIKLITITDKVPKYQWLHVRSIISPSVKLASNEAKMKGGTIPCSLLGIWVDRDSEVFNTWLLRFLQSEAIARERSRTSPGGDTLHFSSHPFDQNWMPWPCLTTRQAEGCSKIVCLEKAEMEFGEQPESLSLLETAQYFTKIRT